MWTKYFNTLSWRFDTLHFTNLHFLNALRSVDEAPWSSSFTFPYFIENYSSSRLPERSTRCVSSVLVLFLDVLILYILLTFWLHFLNALRSVDETPWNSTFTLPYFTKSFSSSRLPELSTRCVSSVLIHSLDALILYTLLTFWLHFRNALRGVDGAPWNSSFTLPYFTKSYSSSTLPEHSTKCVRNILILFLDVTLTLHFTNSLIIFPEWFKKYVGRVVIHFLDTLILYTLLTLSLHFRNTSRGVKIEHVWCLAHIVHDFSCVSANKN